jgi:hypothetical protein
MQAPNGSPGQLQRIQSVRNQPDQDNGPVSQFRFAIASPCDLTDGARKMSSGSSKSLNSPSDTSARRKGQGFRAETGF